MNKQNKKVKYFCIVLLTERERERERERDSDGARLAEKSNKLNNVCCWSKFKLCAILTNVLTKNMNM